jgi:hypothetical protein
MVSDERKPVSEKREVLRPGELNSRAGQGRSGVLRPLVRLLARLLARDHLRAGEKGSGQDDVEK